MSTVRQHLGLLWLSRRALMTSNPQYDKAWAEQASLFVGVHLNELIELAGGAEIEEWVRKSVAEIPADFPHLAPTTSTVSAPDQQQIEWSHDLQSRLIAASQDITETDEARNIMAEAACLLAALAGRTTSGKGEAA